MKLAFDPAISLPQSGAGKTDDPDSRNDPQALRSLCQDFESILIQSMFKEMRKTIPESDLLNTDMASDLFDEMMDMEVAREMAKKGGFGLADQLYRQLQGPAGGADKR